MMCLFSKHFVRKILIFAFLRHSSACCGAHQTQLSRTQPSPTRSTAPAALSLVTFFSLFESCVQALEQGKRAMMAAHDTRFHVVLYPYRNVFWSVNVDQQLTVKDLRHHIEDMVAAQAKFFRFLRPVEVPHFSELRFDEVAVQDEERTQIAALIHIPKRNTSLPTEAVQRVLIQNRSSEQADGVLTPVRVCPRMC